MKNETDLLTIEQLTEVRKAAKLLWESGILRPHEKQHMWDVCQRIDITIKEKTEQERSQSPGH